jgi:hypothetical protein
MLFFLFFYAIWLEHIFFYAFWTYTFFSMTPLSFCKITKREISLDFGVFIFLVDGWHVLHNSRCRS